MIRLLSLLWATALASTLASAAPLAAETGSFFTLTTGNGYGFALFDEKTSRLVAFLDHPYRFIRPGKDERRDGIERRNLLAEFSLGLVENGATSWLDQGAAGSAAYAEETNIIRAASERNGRSLERYFFSPFGLEQNALVGTLHAARATKTTEGVARLELHLGAPPVSPSFWESTIQIAKIPGEEIHALAGPDEAWAQTGQGLGTLLFLPLQRHTRATCEATKQPLRPGGPPCPADQSGLSLAGPLGAAGDFGVLVAYVENPGELPTSLARLRRWRGSRQAGELVRGALREWRSWRKPPPFPAQDVAEKKLWRQSEAVLRMAQVRDRGPSDESRTSHGMLLASLAPGAWATGWVRDGAYASVALTRSGHFREAKDSLNFFLNAQPVGKFKAFVGGADYRISLTRYFGSGEEETDYSNQKTPNIETDGWGLVLWAARQYLDQSRDLTWLRQPTRHGSVYEVLRNGVAEALANQLEASPRIAKPDSSIWEVHQENARHFAFTTITAARGLCDFAAIAQRFGQRADHEKFRQLADDVRRDFTRAFTSPEGYLLGSTERAPGYDLDGSVVEAYNFGLISPATPVARATLHHLEKLRTAAGGFARLGGEASYDVDEWSFVDLRMAGAYRRMHKAREADGLLALVLRRAARNGQLIPEMYNSRAAAGALGAYRGSIPMVGYGNGAYMLALLDRAGLWERQSCE